MKFFHVAALSTLAVLAVAQDSAPSTPEARCAQKCEKADICCTAACYHVPCPSEDMADETTECSRDCDQGDGSAADAVAFGECLDACRNTHFMPTSGSGGSDDSDDSEPTPTDASEATPSATNSEDNESETATVSATGTASGTASGTATSTASTTSDDDSETSESPNAASSITVSSAGFFGLILAAFAL